MLCFNAFQMQVSHLFLLSLQKNIFMAVRNEINMRLEGMNTALEKIYGLQLNKAIDAALLLAYSSFNTWIDERMGVLMRVSGDGFLKLLQEGDFESTLLDKLAELLHLTIALHKENGDTEAVIRMQNKLQMLIAFVNERDRTFSVQRDAWLQAIENDNIETK